MAKDSVIKENLRSKARQDAVNHGRKYYSDIYGEHRYLPTNEKCYKFMDTKTGDDILVNSRTLKPVLNVSECRRNEREQKEFDRVQKNVKEENAKYVRGNFADYKSYDQDIFLFDVKTMKTKVICKYFAGGWKFFLADVEFAGNELKYVGKREITEKEYNNLWKSPICVAKFSKDINERRRQWGI